VSLVKGLLLGMMATVVTAALPAWEAASVPPRAALSRSDIEARAGALLRWVALGGVAMQIAGAVLLLVPAPGLTLSFAGTFAVVVGAAMLTPLVMRLLLRIATPVMAVMRGPLGQMGTPSLANALRRTSRAVAALTAPVPGTLATP